ncbi:uncharacterized protein LOC127880251 [Dreissena polymorpha]|uniref:Uncharacterized protein n=1 Tax=Dreissena polymorpha TaxID=45954 RepID=A0A9D4QR50_DREPO|nr:uncharacterized protein LOC127880251 [Dreissena polymorpha]KAH3840511.1 hypothetical protein DPMN_113961 [Dreissena polymorpha]
MGCGGSKTSATTPRRAPTSKSQKSGGGGGGGNQTGQTPRKKSQAPVDEKGYKKRIRENLREATAGGEIEPLEKCMEIFVNNHLEDGGDFSDAQRRMEFLLIRKEIRDACMRRHPVVLEKAIQRVEASPYKRQLKPYLDRAYYLKQHQNELDTFRHDISDLEQATVSEIRSYNHPPPGVHQTMVAVYMILGYPEDHLLDWTEITALMGRYGANSLLREVAAADTKKIDNVTGLRARNYLGQYTLDEVRAGSNGAAAFYVWASRMVGKYEGGKQKGVDSSPKKLTNSGAKGQPPGKPAGQPATPITNTKPAGPVNDTKNAKQQQNTKQQQQTNAKQPSAKDTNNTKANKQEPPKANPTNTGAKGQPAVKPGGQQTVPSTKNKPADPGNDAKNAKQQQNTKQQQQTNNAKQTSAKDANDAKATKQEPPKANKQEPPKANKQQPQTTDNTKTVSKQANGTSQVTPVKKSTKVKG